MNARAVEGARELNVLVVEDEFFLREDIAWHLTAAGYAVLQAVSGEEAIAICEAGTPIDVVFTDIQLRGRASGWDVAETFRGAYPGLPVIYASANAADRRRCVSESHFLNKPYCADEVLTRCRQLCGRC